MRGAKVKQIRKALTVILDREPTKTEMRQGKKRYHLQKQSYAR
jgi:hypothetical protein